MVRRILSGRPRGISVVIGHLAPHETEANKVRPAVIVSNDLANQAVERNGRGLVVIVPITGNTQRVYPFQVALSPGKHQGLTKPSKAQAEQIRAVDRMRLRKHLGHLAPHEMEALDTALRIQRAL